VPGPPASGTFAMPRQLPHDVNTTATARRTSAFQAARRTAAHRTAARLIGRVLTVRFQPRTVPTAAWPDPRAANRPARDPESHPARVRAGAPAADTTAAATDWIRCRHRAALPCFAPVAGVQRRVHP